MTPKERAAMQQALEACEAGKKIAKLMAQLSAKLGHCDLAAEFLEDGIFERTDAAIREALAEQDKQEPVAWRVRGYSQFKTGNPAPWRYVDGADKPTVNKPDCCDFEPLYAAPVRTKDLTDDEIDAIPFNVHQTNGDLFFARAVIAKDREKNK